MQIVVTALVANTKLEIGTYADPAIAEAVATSWARWSGCRAAILEQTGSPPLVLIRPGPAPAPTPVR
jgi:hypothetical protein